MIGKGRTDQLIHGRRLPSFIFEGFREAHGHIDLPQRLMALPQKTLHSK